MVDTIQWELCHIILDLEVMKDTDLVQEDLDSVGVLNQLILEEEDTEVEEDLQVPVLAQAHQAHLLALQDHHQDLIKEETEDIKVEEE
jgi:hypothetical protein